MTGTIPSTIGGNENLIFLDISNNKIEGTIPSEIFDISALEIAYIGNNTLTGPIPENYYEPDNLRELWVDGNELSGSVPDVPEGKFEQLEELILNKNLLTGAVPESICNLRDDANGKIISLHSDCAQPPSPPQIECECCTKCTTAAGSEDDP
mmetsp:Transcript_3166/g.6212  ORF Transcript_3166/g.6212 Transcript_3166/m.6212 type:complete len:152 (+) Transcript_3166:170-625(+)